MFHNVLLLFLLQFSWGSGDDAEFWKLTEKWPSYDLFGQISAVSVDTAGNVYVFHRGSRVWDYSSFSSDDRFRQRNLGPILEETIVVLDSKNGTARTKTGDRIFYMPHGLTVDHQNNIWITDVALHQVFKYPSINLMSLKTNLVQPEITLGISFEPGDDDTHFCKPTDVAVDKNTGEFYVSDGYCNSRIIKYNKLGNKLLSWGRHSDSTIGEYILNVPHALSIAVDESIIFVADRENLRTVAYNASTGKFLKAFDEHKRIFSIAYSSFKGKHLYTLSNSSGSSPGVVTIYDVKSGTVSGKFSPPNFFTNPHTIAMSSDGQFCYAAELSPHRVWKFERALEAQALAIAAGYLKADSSKNNGEINYVNDKANHDFLGGTVLAVGVVSFVILITFLIFAFHMYKKKAGYSQYEMRRLILDDEEEVEIAAS